MLWPIGTGTVKACVNVFGAKQFHPILQSSLIESYYVNFYSEFVELNEMECVRLLLVLGWLVVVQLRLMLILLVPIYETTKQSLVCINIGALTGGVIVPIVAQWNVTVAYFIPVCVLGAGVMLFSAGTGKYVKPKPKHDIHYVTTGVLEACGCGKTRRSQRERMIHPSPSESKVGIGTIALVSALVVPFNVAYAQMATTFIVQGSVMRPFGLVDAPMMNNADAISVLAFGYIIGNVIYPALNARQIKIPTTYKFAIGSAFGALALGCAIFTDYEIHRTYEATGEAISVLWQAFPYFLIGIGEIFAVSAAYEVAFTVAPAKMKSLASAANLFMVGGAPNVMCLMLYNACRSWFINSKGTANIHKLKDYASAKVVNYFWLLEIISLMGVIVNILPPVKNWVASIEEAAAETVKSPMSTPVIRKNLMQRRKLRTESSNENDEETPLVKSKKHVNYLKYGSGPQLLKMGSMRAGPSLKKKVPPHSQHRPPVAGVGTKEQAMAQQVRNKLLPYANSETPK